MEGAVGRGDAPVLPVLWMHKECWGIPCPRQAHPPGMVPTDWPLEHPRKQPGVLENAAVAMGWWEGAGASHGTHVEGT